MPFKASCQLSPRASLNLRIHRMFVVTGQMKTAATEMNEALGITGTNVIRNFNPAGEATATIGMTEMIEMTVGAANSIKNDLSSELLVSAEL